MLRYKLAIFNHPVIIANCHLDIIYVEAGQLIRADLLGVLRVLKRFLKGRKVSDVGVAQAVILQQGPTSCLGEGLAKFLGLVGCVIL